MSNDVDVKVGIQVTGDASGAKAVDEAIKQVGESAKTVAQETGNAAQQAAEAAAKSAEAAAKAAQSVADNIALLGQKNKGIEEKKTEIDDLHKSFLGLADEKLKGGVSGLTTSLDGLISGDKSKGLSGLAQSLYSLSGAIPLPGAALLASFAVTAIVGVWKSLQESAEETAEVLNEFGQTVDAEMENIEAWANKQIEWDGLKESFGSIKGEFEKATKLTETLRDAMLKTFNQTYKFQIEGLKEQIDAAKASGDAQRQAMLEQNLKQTEQIQSIVNNTVALDQHKEKLQALIESAELERQMIQRKEEIAKADVQRMEELSEMVKAFAGNGDALHSSSTSSGIREGVIERVMEKIEALTSEMKTLTEKPAFSGPNVTGSVPVNEGYLAGISKELEGLEKLKQGLLDFPDIAKRAADGHQYVTERIIEDKQQLTQAVADVVAKKSEIADAESSLANTIRGVDSSVVGVAKELAEEYRKTNEAVQGGLTEGVEALKPVGEIAAQAGKLIGVGTDGLQTSVEGMGADVSGSSEAASEAIGEGNALIKAAVEGTATEAVAAGDEIKQGAQEFRSKIGEAATNWITSATDLLSSSRTVGRMVADMSAAHLSLAQEIASLRAQTNSALAAANLALSQNRNSGR